MGGYLEKPETAKHEEVGSGNGLQFALSSMQGWREEQEDAHACHIHVNKEKLKSWSFFMVFDGHGGDKASQRASTSILRAILEQDYFVELLNCYIVTDYNCDKVKSAILQAFLDLDMELRLWEESNTAVGGSTAVGCLMAPKHLFYINLGDSRAFHVRSEPRGEVDRRSKTTVNYTTTDQKPGDTVEKTRINKAGAEVFALGGVGPERIEGELAVSRAFGDFSYKQNVQLTPSEQQVSVVPAIEVVERDDSDTYICIGCDGIYDVMTNEQLNDLISYKMSLQRELNLQRIANEVLEACLALGSRDNMSLILISLNKTRVAYDETEHTTDMAVVNTLRDYVTIELRNRGVNRPDVAVVMKNLPEKRFDVPGAGICGRALQISDMCDEYYQQLDSQKSVISESQSQVKTNAKQRPSDSTPRVSNVRK